MDAVSSSTFKQTGFTEHAKSQYVNDRLLDLVEPCKVVVDLGMGSGPIPERLYRRAAEGKKIRPVTVIGIDPNPERLEEAALRLAPYNPIIVSPESYDVLLNKGQGKLKEGLFLLQGYAQQLQFLPSDSIDTIIMANAIHLVPPEELQLVIKEATRLLKYGGRFGANSAYSDGYEIKGTGLFFAKWVIPVKNKLKEMGITRDEKQKKDTSIVVRANLEALMAEKGLSVIFREQSAVDLDQEFYEAIAKHDSDFTDGVLKHFGAVIGKAKQDVLAQVSKTLTESVGHAMGGKKTIPRNYYWVVAEKKQI